ncbi:MAG: hydrogenase expression/formation protein HypE [Acidobacteriota bacterium]
MDNKILMAHGNGGELMGSLINDLIVDIFGKDSVQLDDSAIVDPGEGRVVFTTDTYTITPVFFEGGDIGKLAVNGTINDLAVMGAEPRFLSCGLVLEEGFEISSLKKILQSMKKAIDYAGVKIVTGDTKVVDKGSADKIFINTSGIGIMKGYSFRNKINPGDKIIINGTIGDHGISIMAERSKLSFSEGLVSDSQPLNRMLLSVGREFGEAVNFVRDATRGGVASVLNEVVSGKDFSIKLIEDKLPVRKEVSGVCEILGLDPLYSANEGKAVLITAPGDAEGIVKEMKKFPEGRDAEVIGEVDIDFPGKVYVETYVRGKRILPTLQEDQLPRIC